MFEQYRAFGEYFAGTRSMSNGKEKYSARRTCLPAHASIGCASRVPDHAGAGES